VEQPCEIHKLTQKFTKSRLSQRQGCKNLRRDQCGLQLDYAKTCVSMSLCTGEEEEEDTLTRITQQLLPAGKDKHSIKAKRANALWPLQG